jgi:hypothetical protein
MAGAQQNLLLALDLRAEALQTIANEIPNALGTDSAASASGVIAAEMQAFLASDVIYAQRVVPLITQALADQKIDDQTVATSRFLPDLGWLTPQVVTQRITGNSGGTTASGALKSGTHGHGMLSVSVGTTTLQAEPAVNQIKLTPTPTFSLLVANQGQNDETGVVVELEIEGAGTPIVLKKTINTTAMTRSPPVLIPLTGSPPVGETVRVVGRVVPVRGESDTANNTLTYLADFSR